MKEIKKLLHIVALVGVISTSANAQTTTITVNGNTTTTTTITNTPISTVNTPNTPNIGDLTTTTINQTTTDVMTKVANTNSGNLVPTNFCDNSWTGTQKTASLSGQTSDLGCNYITGKNTTTYLENSVNLVDKGITKPEQNLGFTQSASAYTYHYWSWNSYLNFSHSVINNDTGGTITQNRVWNHNNSIPGSTKNLDNIIIGENSTSGYTSKMRFDLSSSQGGGANWQGVDINNPNLSITYNKLTSTSLTEQTTTTSIISCESLGTCYVSPVIEQPKIQIITTPQTIDEQIKTTPITTITTAPAPAELSTSITGISSPLSSMAPKESSVKTQEMAMATPMTFNEGPKTTTSTSITSEEPKTTTSTSITSEEPKTVAPSVSETTTAMTKEEPKTSSESSETTTAMTKEEPTTSTKESNATTSSGKETSTASKETDTKTESTTEKSSSTTTQSTSSENSKTEGSTTQTANEKTVSTKENTVDTKGSSIDVKVKAAVEKVERELKSIGDKTKAIQEIKIDGIKAGAPNLAVYENRSFYEPKYYNGVPNPDFYLQADIAQKPVYANVSLVAYTSKDPIGKQQAAMQEIQDEMNDIIIQLEELKRK